MNKYLIFSAIFFVVITTYATAETSKKNINFEKIVPSIAIIAQCTAQKGDERGAFGITYSEGKITHEFLVLTGVYYNSCKSLEKDVNQLKRKNAKLILFGSEPNFLDNPDEIVWRWRSLRTLSGKKCISYFLNDC